MPQLSPLKADVLVHLKESTGFLQLISSDLSRHIYISPTSDGDPNLRVGVSSNGDSFSFSYSDGARFVIDRAGREIWADWPDYYTIEDAATYLIGPVIGFALRLRGALPLHASAIAVENRAIAVMGAAGAGKSTTAAGLATLGHAVLADDLAALREVDGEFQVQSGYPRVNVWPDSAAALFGSKDSLAHISPSWDKRFVALDHSGMRFERRPLPLGAIYILGDRDPKLSAPVIENLGGSFALVKLLANTYVNYLLDEEMRQSEFSILSRLLTNIPVRLVRPPADTAYLRGLCEAISIDAQELTGLATVSAHLEMS